MAGSFLVIIVPSYLCVLGCSKTTVGGREGSVEGNDSRSFGGLLGENGFRCCLNCWCIIQLFVDRKYGGSLSSVYSVRASISFTCVGVEEVKDALMAERSVVDQENFDRGSLGPRRLALAGTRDLGVCGKGLKLNEGRVADLEFVDKWLAAGTSTIPGPRVSLLTKVRTEEASFDAVGLGVDLSAAVTA